MSLKPVATLGLFFSLLWSAAATAIPSGYQVYTDGSSNTLYLKAEQVFVLLHAPVSIPLKVYPHNGLIRLTQASNGSWSATAVNAASLNGITLAPSNSHQLALADVDGDGKPDLIVQSQYDGVALRNIEGTLALTNLGWAGAIGTELSDQNGDGIADLVRGSNVHLGSVSGVFIDTDNLSQLDSATLVGTTGGAFSVNEAGAVNYSIPLTLAPGTADVQPQVTINYSSQGGDGLMGVGWSVSAGSAISRCPKDLERDGVIAGITFSKQDRLCLDGQKLIPNGKNNNVGVSDDAYWSAAAYHLEIDNYSEIVPSPVRAADGSPAAFQLTNKAGETHYYGDVGRAAINGLQDYDGSNVSSDAFVEASGLNPDGTLFAAVNSKARAWAIKAIVDVKGNYIYYRYAENQETGEHYLTAIDYSGKQSDSKPRSRVHFEYQERSNARSGWFAGSRLASRKLLKQITTFDGIDPLRRYLFVYGAQASAEVMPYITNIQECSAQPDGGWECFKPLLFDVKVPDYTVSAGTKAIQVASDSNKQEDDPFVIVPVTNYTFKLVAETWRNLVNSPKATGADHARLLDMDGDGALDQLYPESGQWKLRRRFGRSDAAATDDIMFNSVVDKPEHVQLIDADGDGRTDLLFRKGGNWWLGRYRPGTDAVVTTCTTVYLGTTSSGSYAAPITEHRCEDKIENSSFLVEAVDVNGLTTDNAVGYEGKVVVSDVTGDGLEDIVYHQGNNLMAYINTSANGLVSFKPQSAPLINLGDATYMGASIVHKNADIGKSSWVDFNGDGRTDLLLKRSAEMPACQIWTSGYPASAPRARTPDKPCVSPEIALNAVLSGWVIYIAQPTAPGADARYAETGLLEGYAASLKVSDISAVDLNGDGLSDLVFVKDQKWFYRLSHGDGSFSAVDRPLLKIVPDSTPSEVQLSAKDHSFHRTTFADANADGIADVLWGKTDSVWEVLLSRPLTASDEVRLVKVSEVNAGTARYRQLADIDGDGLVDLLTATSTTANWQVAYNASKGQGRHYVVNRITDGHGVYTDIQYSQLSDSEVYTSTHSKPVREEPHRYLPVPPSSAWVVKRVASLGAASQEVAVRYRYGGATMDKIAGSYLGFERLTTVDEQSGITTTTTYFLKGRANGTPSTTERYVGDKLIGYSKNELAATPLITANGAVLPYVGKTTDWQWDLNTTSESVSNRSVVVNTFKYDTWGNLTESVVDTYLGVANIATTLNDSARVARTKSVNQYSGAGGAAKKGRLSKTTVTKSRSGVPDIIRETTFTYYADGLLKETVVDPSNSSQAKLTTIYEYDKWGNQTKVTATGAVDAVGTQQSRVSRVEYGADGRLVKKRINALGEAETYLYNGKSADSVSGRVWSTTTTGPNQIATTQYFDLLGTMIREVRADGTSSNITTRYLEAGCDATTDAACFEVVTTSSGAPTTTARFNAFGHEVEKRSQLFTSGTESVVTTTYDSLGKVVSVSNPYWANQSPIYYTNFIYDRFGRVIEEQLPDGGVNKTTYRGNSVEYTNAKGQKRIESFNELGELTLVSVNASAVGPTSSLLNNYYDAFGNLVRSQTRLHGGDTGVSTSSTYDAYGRKKTMLDPDKGSWRYSYNAFGELISQIDAGGRITTQAYDQLGRVTKRNEPHYDSPNITICWDYGTTAHQTQRAVGKLRRVHQYESAVTNCANPGVAVAFAESYSYDRLGRPHSTTTNIGSKTFTTSSTYDSVGRVATTTYPEGLVAGFTYTNIGALQKVRDASNGQDLRTIDEVDASGRVTKETLAAGVKRNTSYYSDSGYVNDIQITGGAGFGQYAHLSYKYDEIGNVTQRHHTLYGGASFGEVFSYDAINRMTARQLTYQGGFNASGFSAIGTYRNSYDARGNLLTKDQLYNADGQLQAGSGYCYQYSDANTPNRLSAVHAGARSGSSCSGSNHRSYGYDANGNVISDGARDIKYDANDKPWLIVKGDAESAFRYAPDGSRYLRIDQVREANTSLPGSPLYAEVSHYTTYSVGAYERVERAAHYNGERPALVEHKYSIGGAVITRSGSSVKTHILHTDNQGSVIAITDATKGSVHAGKVVQQFVYDPWGKQTTISADYSLIGAMARGEVTQRGYTGHEMLKGVELTHMNGRVYDADIGRFLQADPFVQAPNNLQNYNRYSYVLNNPMTYTDPSGYFFKKLYKALMKITGTWAVHKFLAKNQGLADIIQTALNFIPVVGVFASAHFAADRTFYATGSLTAATKSFGISVGSAYAFNAIGNYYNGAGGAGFGAMGRADLAGASGYYNFGGNFLSAGQIAGQITAHAVVGGVTSVASGGKFGHGFVSAGFAKGIGTPIHDATGGFGVEGFVGTVVVGGTASELSGGKFANGAKSAAYGYIFNNGSKHFKQFKLAFKLGQRQTFDCSDQKHGCFGGAAGYEPTSREARRQAMRDAGIPTSQQPISQSRNQSGREYSYDVPASGGGTQRMSVQQQTMDSSHPGQCHWEAGPVKMDPLTGHVRFNNYGRPALTNDKSKVDY